MTKRLRNPVAKENELLVKYGKEHGEEDLFYCWPDNDTGMKADCRIVMFAFEREKIFDGKIMRQLLEERGYDITTLKFSIMKQQQ